MEVPHNKVRPCRRGCGAMVKTLDPPPAMLKECFEKWGGICVKCLTPEELERQKSDTVKALGLHFSKKGPGGCKAANSGG